MVRSHTHELIAPPRPRNACDRCHAQKLRCLKTTEGDTCLRCVKFGAQCVFSARTPRRRIQSQMGNAVTQNEPKTSHNSSLEHGIFPTGILAATNLTSDGSHSNLPMDMGLYNFTNPDWHNLSNFTNATVGSHMSTPLCDLEVEFGGFDNTPKTVADVVRELADLNLELVKHASTLPIPLNPTSPQTLPQSRLFAIDQTFTLTKKFVGILKGLWDSCSRSSTGFGAIDEATVLLFLSCHHRLIDIYECIFTNMRGCADNPHIPAVGEELVILPVLQIGSFIPTQIPEHGPSGDTLSSTFSMHMIFIFILSTRLCTQLQESITATFSRIQDGDLHQTATEVDYTKHLLHNNIDILKVGSEKTALLEVAREAIWNRSNEINHQIQLTKQALLRFSMASL